MNNKEYLINCCNELKIDYEKIFVISSGKENKGNRYICKNSHLKRKESNKYLIKCFNDQDLYLVWNLKTPMNIKKDNFTLNKKKVKSSDNIFIAKKSLEYIGWGEEDVIILNRDNLKQFLLNIKGE